jgi:hypothetical protein
MSSADLPDPDSAPARTAAAGRPREREPVDLPPRHTIRALLPLLDRLTLRHCRMSPADRASDSSHRRLPVVAVRSMSA